MNIDESPIELALSVKQDGIKMSISVEIYPKNAALSFGLDSIQSSADKTFSDPLDEAIRPILKELIPPLVEANHLVSGSLAKCYLNP